MNASSWRKAVDLITQGTQANHQVQAAATADSIQLEGFPLSTLSVNDSGPPQVNYGTEQSLTVSTPRASSTSTQETQATDTYRQIIPGMSEHLYPTLVADSSLSTTAVDNCSTLQRQITSELDKYLQEATECDRDDNYYDGQHVATDTSSPQQEANLLEEDNDTGSDEEVNNAIVPESHERDTGMHYGSPPESNNQPQDELETIPEEEEPQSEENKT